MRVVVWMDISAVHPSIAGAAAAAAAAKPHTLQEGPLKWPSSWILCATGRCLNEIGERLELGIELNTRHDVIQHNIIEISTT